MAPGTPEHDAQRNSEREGGVPAGAAADASAPTVPADPTPAPEEYHRLDPRMRGLWAFSDGVTFFVLATVCMVISALLAEDPTMWGEAHDVLSVAFGIGAVAFAVLTVAIVAMDFTWRYYRFGYLIKHDFLFIRSGWIWRTETCIPFVRVQDTDLSQGPLERMFGLSKVTVSTAATGHPIPGIASEHARALRDEIARHARDAREDV